MDCPVEKVPRISSVHENPRVTVAVLVSFPTEPFYFVDIAHMDEVLWPWNKVEHTTYLGLVGELTKLSKQLAKLMVD